VVYAEKMGGSRRAVRALVDFGRSIWSAIIWVAVWSPVWLLAALFLVLLNRKHRRRQGPGSGSAS
jgi:hypothetical protein